MAHLNAAAHDGATANRMIIHMLICADVIQSNAN